MEYAESRVRELPDQRGTDDVPLTILFTDVEGSTALQSGRGDTEARAVIAACESLIRRHVEAHGGRVVKSLGDGLMVAFSSPRRGVTCALAINRALASTPPAGLQEVRLRVGVHTGEVLSVDDDLHGAAVSAAARICARATGGEVLISDVVRQLCGTLPEVGFEDRGRVTLKGFPDRWRLFRAVSVAVAPHVGPGELSFVGREDLQAELRELTAQTARGRGSVVMLGGEPGVGKTRLTQQVGAGAREQGFEVHVGHCHEQGDLPYMPWVEMLEAVIRTRTPQELLTRFGPQASAIAQMAPALRRSLPELPPLPELPGAEQRWYLFSSVREYLSRLAAERPRLLVFEDLHWADESTLLLLEHAAEWVEHVPILLIGTYREAASKTSERLGLTLARLAPVGHARLTSLPRLREADVEQMLTHLGGDRPPAAIVAAIYGETDGNAFFVEEIFRNLVESGRLLDEQGRFRADVRIDDLDVPANVRLVIEERLGRLSEPTRQLLGLAAVLGRRFAYTVVEAAGDWGADDLLRGIEEADRAQLLFEETSGADIQYSFSHELVRQTLLAGLSAPRRQRHHARAADALEQVHATELDSHAADIALHLLASGNRADTVRTVGHLARAGDRSQSAAAFEEALRAYQQALELLPAERRRERADLLLKLGLAHRSLRHWDAAVATWDEAITLLEQLGDVEAAAELCWELSEQLIWAYRFVELGAVLERGLEVLGDRPSSHRPRLMGMTGLLVTLGGQHEAGADHISAANTLAEQDGDRQLRAEVWLFEAIYHYFLMRLPQLVEAGRRATEQLRELGSVWLLADGLSFRSTGASFTGLFDEAGEVHREVERLAAGLGNWAALSTTHRGKFALAAATRADLDELGSLAGEQVELASDTESPGWMAYAHSLRGMVAFWRGDWEHADDDLEEGVSLAMPFWYGVHHGALLLARAYGGRASEVRAQLEELRAMLPTPGQPNLIGSWSLAVMAAEAVAVLGDEGWAQALYPLVAEALETGTIMRQLDGRLIQTAAGMTAALAGHPDAARQHFETALLQADQLPHLLERPHARHFYARFLLEFGAEGKRERALVLLEEAIDGYARIGMPRHETMARELFTRSGADPQRGPLPGTHRGWRRSTAQRESEAT